MTSIVLLLDTETTGTDENAVAIEVAVMLYDVRHAAAVRSFASLIRADGNPAWAVNRIPVDLLVDAPAPESVWPAVRRFAERADAIVAHGADFDRRFVPAEATAGKPWICSMEDVLWPRAQKVGESLVKTALAHDLGVSHAHRAAVDVDMIARLLTRVHEMGHDLQSLLARGMRPKARFEIVDRSFDARRNELAKDAGFRWNEDGTRRWLRTMAIEDAAALPFETRQVA
jgi:DNA polymerase-3 subunit epsilon